MDNMKESDGNANGRADSSNELDAVKLKHLGLLLNAEQQAEDTHDESYTTYSQKMPDRFTVKEFLGEGGFGRIYKAWDSTLERVVAVKFSKSGNQTKMLLKEAQTQAGLSHSSIGRIFDSGEYEDAFFIVTEFIDGQDLSAWRENAVPSQLQIAKVCAQLLSALSHAHSKGVLHRDIKPANILVNHEGTPVLLDFGLAKRLDNPETVTERDGLRGTIPYMSPEHLSEGGQGIEVRSDVFSFGIVLFELLTGERPFRGDAAAIIRQIQEDDPVSPRILNSHVDTDLETVCLKCLEKNPGQRYQRANEVTQELERYLRAEPICAKPIGMFGLTWRWAKRKPLAATLSVCLLSALIGLATLSVWNNVLLAEREAALVQQRNLTEKEKDTYEFALSAFARNPGSAVLDSPRSMIIRRELLDADIDNLTKLEGAKPGDPATQLALAVALSKRVINDIESGRLPSLKDWEKGNALFSAVLDHDLEPRVFEEYYTGSYIAETAVDLRKGQSTLMRATWDHLEEYSKTMKHIRSLHEKYPDCQMLTSDYACLLLLNGFYLRNRKSLDEAIDELQAIHADVHRNRTSTVMLCYGLIERAKQMGQPGKPNANLLAEARQIFEQYRKSANDYRMLSDTEQFYGLIAGFGTDKDKLSCKKEVADALWKQVDDYHLPPTNSLKTLGQSLKRYSTAAINQDTQNWDERVRSMQHETVIRTILSRGSLADPNKAIELSECHARLALTLCEAARYEEARIHAGHAESIAILVLDSELLEAVSTSSLIRNIARCFINCAVIIKNNNGADGRSESVRAIRILESALTKVRQEFKQSRRIEDRAYAAKCIKLLGEQYDKTSHVDALTLLLEAQQAWTILIEAGDNEEYGRHLAEIDELIGNIRNK